MGSRAMTTSACELVRAATAVLRSTETHSMTVSMSCRGPKIALASSRPRSGSKPAYRPLASRLENGAALSSAPIRILPFVWSAYMYVASSKRGRAGVREDELFPSASVIKLPLVMTLYADATRGLIDLDERVAVGDRVDGSGVLRHMRDVERLSLRDLAMLAIIVSDNTATNRLIERIG